MAAIVINFYEFRFVLLWSFIFSAIFIIDQICLYVRMLSLFIILTNHYHN